MLQSLSILIPAYNVDRSICDVVDNAYTVGKKITNNLEIIALDDASVDQTSSLLSKLQKKYRCLRVFHHAANRGYGVTIKELYTKGSKQWLFSLPSDNQFDAQELYKLVPLTSKADVILGRRLKRHDSPRRLIQSRVYNFLLNVFFGLSIHDVNTIRLMKRDVIKSVSLMSNTAFVDAELAIKAKRKGFWIIEVPITHKKRHENGATGGKILTTILPTIADMLRTLAFH